MESEMQSGTMKNLLKPLKTLIEKSIVHTLNLPTSFANVTASTNPKFDYSCPSAMRIFSHFKSCKEEGAPKFANAQEIAEKIAKSFTDDALMENGIESFETNNQGFIFFKISQKFIENEISNVIINGLNFTCEHPEEVLVDFSSPNIAKEMHVGHLRSTIIGESICRILEFTGNKVRRINHLGDWGTQFGMLIAHMEEAYPNYIEAMPDVKDLNAFYKEAKGKFEKDAEFKKKSQLTVVKLQSGDEKVRKAWQLLCSLSRTYFEVIYSRLHATIEDRGESFYNSMIPSVLAECEAKGMVKLDEGAKCIFIEGKELPLIVVKSDGGFNYDSTDLAAVWHRLMVEKYKRVIVITDRGQEPHFMLIYEAAKIAGWHTPPETRLDHMGFGVVLGADGKKFRSSKGDTYKLMDLLNEAQEHAYNDLKSRVNDTEGGKTNLSSEEEILDASEKIGMAAIKYFDLKQNRISDYKFELEKMLDLKGNTAVYLIYSYVRLCSILRKSGMDNEKLRAIAIEKGFKITHPHERLLCLLILRFPEILEQTMDELAINKLCDLIYNVATKVAEGYSKYRILDDPDTDTRILLVEAVRKLMLRIFSLLAIEPIEKI